MHRTDQAASARRLSFPQASSRFRHSLVFALLAGATLSIAVPAAAVGQSSSVASEVTVTNRNAAVLYFRTWLTMDPALQEVYKSTDAGPGLAPDGAEVLEAQQDTVHALLRAASQESADWEVEVELGPNALLPSLGQMRAGARVLAADAIRCGQANSPDAAAARVVAIYRSGHHISNQGVLVSSLVGIAITNLANRTAKALAEAGQLSPAAARTILAQALTIDPGNPCHLRESVIGERNIMSQYLESFVGTPNQDDSVSGLFGSDDSNPLAELDAAAFQAGINDFRRFHDDVLAAWDTPDASDNLSRLEQDAENGSYGEFGKLLAPSFSRARSNVERLGTETAATIKLLREVADG